MLPSGATAIEGSSAGATPRAYVPQSRPGSFVAEGTAPSRTTGAAIRSEEPRCCSLLSSGAASRLQGFFCSIQRVPLIALRSSSSASWRRLRRTSSSAS